tara:strand:+ start:114 stop:380 length:267 start_codon:yes stop_codon:yes gene_type:complete
MTETTERLEEAEVTIIVELMKLQYPEFENQEMGAMALQISELFDVDCSTQDLEKHYSDANVDDIEARVPEEDKFHSNIEEYESRDRFS